MLAGDFLCQVAATTASGECIGRNKEIRMIKS